MNVVAKGSVDRQGIFMQSIWIRFDHVGCPKGRIYCKLNLMFDSETFGSVCLVLLIVAGHTVRSEWLCPRYWQTDGGVYPGHALPWGRQAIKTFKHPNSVVDSWKADGSEMGTIHPSMF